MAAALELRRVSFSDPVIQAMVDELQAEYVRRYGGPDATPLDASMFEPPDGAFFAGFEPRSADPVAMAGWRMRPDVERLGGSVSAEVKRLYVAGRARGAGHARTLLRHLESTARDAGADTLVAETGMKQPEAIRLYESLGYESVEGFGYYRDFEFVRYFGKRL